MIKFHSLKDTLIEELHNRPFPTVELPAQVSNIVVLNPAGRDMELEGLKVLAALHDVPAPEEGVSC